MELELPAVVHEKIVVLSASGDTLAAVGDCSGAISKYNEAWNIVPEPKNE